MSSTASANGRRIVATDGELIYLATKRNDSAALEELFARHADMVWHVCKQILWREADAEDAFQATFLILLRRAAAIRASDSVAAWLYRVAYRTAIAARRRRHKRKTEPLILEKLAAEPPAPEVEYPDLESRYITGILLEELSLLPQKYQRALVLRYLEGRSRREIADQTDLTVAAVQGYLARGKQLLRGRLLRRGVLLSTGMAMLTTTQAASAAPAAVVATNITLGAAVASGAAGALAKLSTPTLQLVDQGARSMFLSTMMAKPVVWVAVAFAAAGVTASQSPGGGGTQEGVVLSAEVGSGQEAGGSEEAGVIQLTAAESPAVASEEPAKKGGDWQLEERPMEKTQLEKPYVEERRIAKPVELPAPRKKMVYETHILDDKPVTVAREVEIPLDPQAQAVTAKKVFELQRTQLDRQREQLGMQVKALRKQAEALAAAESDRAKLDAEAKALMLEAEALRAEAEGLKVELELLQLEMPADVLVPGAGAYFPQPVEVRAIGTTPPAFRTKSRIMSIGQVGTTVGPVPGPYAAPEVPVPPKPPTDPLSPWYYNAQPVASDKLSPGQNIQVEIYSETASADLMDPSMEPRRGMGGMMGGGRGEMGMMGELPAVSTNSTRSFTIEPMGTIAFGAKYGRVKVAGMSIAEAENAIAEKLREQVPDVKVQITLPAGEPLGMPSPGPHATTP